jgi:hypothetical protein
MNTPLIRFDPQTPAATVTEAIRTHGYAVVEGLAPELTRQAQAELSPHFERAPLGSGDFTGLRTQRLARLIPRSMACRQLAVHPLVQQVVTRLLEEQCYHPQLSLTSAIRIHPGETAQSLHRDDNVFPLSHPRPPAVISTIWAVNAFSAENGATRIVPGSHRWDDAERPQEEQAIAVDMPAGSVLMWDGALYHGGGANATRAERASVLMAYALGWLRQYENMVLSVPPDVARGLAPELLALIGYQNHGFLGTYEHDDPREWLKNGLTDVLPAPRDLYTGELAQRPLRRS